MMRAFPIPDLRHQAGLSLIELLVAMVIGLFLVGGLAALSVNSKTTYETQDYASRLQENARFAMQFLNYDLRMSGYYGCADVAGKVGVTGQTGGTYGDKVMFSYADVGDVITLTEDVAESATSLKVSSVVNLADDMEISIADCGASEVVQITDINETSKTLTVTPGLSRAYLAANAEIRFYDVYFYDVQVNGDNIPGLYRTDSSGAQELVQGVEYLRLLYGEDTDADDIPDVYRPQDEVTNWGTVKSIKVGMLMRSISNYKPDDNPTGEFGKAALSTGPFDILDLNGNDAVDPPQGDLRVQRRVFVNTIFVRNHI